jgi:hypothetical protein
MVVCLFLGACLAPACSADVVEVPLPGLLGHYVFDDARVAAFDLGGPLDAVYSAHIRWAGIMVPGVGEGDGVEMPAGEPFPWPAQLAAYMDSGPPVGLWCAYGGPYAGAFEETVRFEELLDIGWDFLLDGEADVVMQIAPLIIIGGVMLVPPEATVTEAVLILDVEFADAVETSTWSSVKGLFRQ